MYSNRLFLFIELQATEIDCKPISNLLKATDVVKRIMIKTDYGTCNGTVYGKLHETIYTYVYCSLIKNYLIIIMNYISIAGIIASVLTLIVKILSEPLHMMTNPTINRLYLYCGHYIS